MKAHFLAVTAITLAAFATPQTALAQGPNAVERVAPEYPRGAERRGIEGLLMAELTLAADGSVTNVVVVETDHPGVFDRAAIRALSGWRYEPGFAGETVKVQLEFALT